MRLQHGLCAFHRKWFSTAVNAIPNATNRPIYAHVGLEVHVQLRTCSKLFSGAGTEYMYATNQQVANFDAALPGTLPVVNSEAARLAVRACRALECTVNTRSMFDRKHYFYADMPAGYQITQQRCPVGENGHLNYWAFDNRPQFADLEASSKTTNVFRVQIEQDSAKNINDLANARTLVDLNRAGIALIEIVTEPNLSSGLDALCLVRELQYLLVKSRITHGHMEQGQLRVDANISVTDDPDQLGVRTEVKNVNSIRHVQQAIEYEIERQTGLLQRGEKDQIINETRGYDYRIGKTMSQRDKEIRQDYRFLPETNLPVLDVSQYLNDRYKMPVKLYSILDQLINHHGLTAYRSHYIALDSACHEYYMAVMSACTTQLAPLVAHYIVVHLSQAISKCKTSWESCPVRPDRMADLCNLLHQQKITEECSKRLILELVQDRTQLAFASDLIQQRDMWLINDINLIRQYCNDVMQTNQKLVNDLEANVRVKKAINKLTNAINKASQFRIPPDLLTGTLKDVLAERNITLPS